MDLDEVRRIVKLMEENQLVEFEFEEGGKKLKLRKAEGHPMMVPAVHASVPPVVRPPEGTAATGAAPAPANENMLEFKSPLVGTYYRAAKPDAEPFVNAGDEVNPESVLCIIEAMKVMNEIKAEVHGVVREIRVKNGQAVEFGETLFVIEKK